MANWALIVDGSVHEITDIDPEGRFAPDMIWKPCGDDVAAGWGWDGTSFSPPAVLAVDLTAYAASKRYAVEIGGFTYKGHTVATDGASQSKIGNGALAATVLGSGFTTEWKAVDGSFFTLDQQGMIAMATAVMEFVSACFGTEASLGAQIQSRAITTAAEIDEAEWPINHN